MTNNDHKDPLSYWQARAVEAELERDELAAMVERLREEFTGNFHGTTRQWDRVIAVLNETPPTALRHIKADTLEREATLMESAEQRSANGAFDMRQVALRLRKRARRYRDGEVE